MAEIVFEKGPGMNQNNEAKNKLLIGYYGLLQSLHLLTLARAGSLMLSGQDSPFPILPPTGGWAEQTLPFLFGLAAMDVLGIALAIVFSYQALFKGRQYRLLGILSLTIFITGAVVFAAGTYPSGAWSANPIAYWMMVVLFLPSGLLYLRLLTQNQHKKVPDAK